ncbi:MAG: hypothetical protein AAF628_27835 [Planctomycetota bacterium]
MDYQTYKLIHLIGLVALLLGLGGILLGRHDEEGKAAKSAMPLHGLGLLLLLVAGFGMLARLEIHWPWPGWTIAKVAIWLVLGALPILVRRGIVPAAIGWPLVIVLASGAAWAAIAKPF